jgi:hypothetical protein
MHPWPQQLLCQSVRSGRLDRASIDVVPPSPTCVSKEGTAHTFSKLFEYSIAKTNPTTGHTRSARGTALRDASRVEAAGTPSGATNGLVVVSAVGPSQVQQELTWPIPQLEGKNEQLALPRAPILPNTARDTADCRTDWSAPIEAQRCKTQKEIDAQTNCSALSWRSSPSLLLCVTAPAQPDSPRSSSNTSAMQAAAYCVGPTHNGLRNLRCRLRLLRGCSALRGCGLIDSMNN